MRYSPYEAMPAGRPAIHRFTILSALALGLAVSSGCRDKDEIRTYRVAASAEPTPRQQPSAPAPAKPAGDPTDRMLGAIVPGPQQAWFFKAVGPNAALDAAAGSIKAFLASVTLEDDRPVWDLPEGWTERPGKSMRLATLVAPGEVELSVIGLPLVDEWDAQVLDNVNRWRGQLKLSPTTAESLADSATPLEGGIDDAMLVDLAGWFDGGGMAPFAGRAKPTAPPAATPPNALAAANSGIPLPPGGGGELTYETPDGWTEGPKTSSIRKASLKTAGGADVTGFVFPAAGAMADPLGNANRWRGEIQLPPTTADGLAAQTKKLSLLGGEGSYFEFVGETEATSVAMVQVGQGVWFFKLRGPKAEVAAQGDAFRAWLDTLSL